MPKPVVLHIDDSPTFRETFAIVLGKAGAVVIGRRDSRDATGLHAGEDYHCLVVDSSGLDYVTTSSWERAQSKVAAIVLTSFPSAAFQMADVVLAKSDVAWHRKVVNEVMDRLPWSHPESVIRRLDVFAALSPEQLEEYRGKILLVSGQPESVIGVASTLVEAEELAAKSRYRKSGCRLVQGPPVRELTLAELEGG